MPTTTTDQQHQPGCPALGGYGHGVEPCACSAGEEVEALSLAAAIKASGQFTNLQTLDRAAAELIRLYGSVRELEAQKASLLDVVEAAQLLQERAGALLVAEAARTAAEKLRADQLGSQHNMQAALNRDAREQLAALKSATGQQPFGYVNTNTGQYFKDVDQCRKGNEGHWRTVYAAPQAAPAAQAVKPAAVAPGQRVTVNAGALQMVVNALRRDAAEGKTARGEMADELQATVAPAPAAVAVPDGWMLVPAAPSDAMLLAIMSEGEEDAARGLDPCLLGAFVKRAGMHQRYVNMLAAAPALAAAPQAQDVQRDAERYRSVRDGVKSGDRHLFIYTMKDGCGTKLLGLDADAAIDSAAIAASAAKGGERARVWAHPFTTTVRQPHYAPEELPEPSRESLKSVQRAGQGGAA